MRQQYEITAALAMHVLEISLNIANIIVFTLTTSIVDLTTLYWCCYIRGWSWSISGTKEEDLELPGV